MALVAAVGARAYALGPAAGPMIGAGLGLATGYLAVRATLAGVYFGVPTVLAVLAPLLYAVPRSLGDGGASWLIPGTGVAWLDPLVPGAVALGLVVLERRLERRRYLRLTAEPDRLLPLVASGRERLARAYLEKSPFVEPAAFDAAPVAALEAPLFRTVEAGGEEVALTAAWELPARYGGWVLLRHGPAGWAVLGEEDELLLVEEDTIYAFPHLARVGPDGSSALLATLASPDYDFAADADHDRELRRRTFEGAERFLEAVGARAGCRWRRLLKDPWDEDAFEAAWREAAGADAPAPEERIPPGLDGRSPRHAYLASPDLESPAALARAMADSRPAAGR